MYLFKVTIFNFQLKDLDPKEKNSGYRGFRISQHRYNGSVPVLVFTVNLPYTVKLVQ